ncbi:cytochrome c oxidase subunit II [Anthocerotibacter panamensis]|uniref:cytochrome c oxidase subunit II n=1 Tax=Anthocerotibacter panamensis TaxID=2857077 RepID=UPI001C404AAF|nr:cytochrome c oxidase subunit II [Anthocerotibacter panamensis]
MNVRKITLRVVGALAVVAIAVISLWYGANNGLLPAEVSSESRDIDQLFRVMLVIATAVFLLVEGALIYSVLAFRQKPGDTTDGPPIHGSVPLEIFWTAVPAAVVLWISVYSFSVSTKVAAGGSGGLGCTVDCPMIVQNTAAPSGKELMVNVTAQQYAWTFKYPGYDTEVGELHVPLGREVIVNMTSKDVIHAFWVPEFRLKQDVIPGRVTRLRFTAIKAGTYPLRCAELCGANHGVMITQVVVDEPKDFEKWEKTELAGGVAQGTTPASAAALALK